MRSLILKLAVATPGVGVIGICIASVSKLTDNSFLYRFQELIAGLVAIAAALIGGAFIVHQVRTSERMARDLQAREFRSARAGLPATLSELVQHELACASELNRLFKLASGEDLLPARAKASFPAIPAGIVASLCELVKLGTEDEARAIEELLSLLQIAQARLRMLEKGINDGHRTNVLELARQLKNCAEVHATISLLFPFARRQSQCPQGTPSDDKVTTSVFLLRADSDLQDLAESLPRTNWSAPT